MIILSSFTPVHEQCLSRLVSGNFLEIVSGDVDEMTEAIGELEACRFEIVGKLKEAHSAEVRHGLGLLYEALSIVIDFVINLWAELIRLRGISSDADVARPHGLGS